MMTVYQNFWVELSKLERQATPEGFVTPEQFMFFDNRCKCNGLDVVDERLRPLVELINKSEDVRTVWSCSGHSYEERLLSNLGDIDGGAEHWYIAMVATKRSRVRNAFDSWKFAMNRSSWRNQRLKVTVDDANLMWAGVSNFVGGLYPIFSARIAFDPTDKNFKAVANMQDELHTMLSYIIR